MPMEPLDKVIAGIAQRYVIIGHCDAVGNKAIRYPMSDWVVTDKLNRKGKRGRFPIFHFEFEAPAAYFAMG